ncbi:MAG: serine/threonine-protein kinase [Nannocystaceae bacterium]|nr:serine/threonine-protein kinase [Nannocystaceae bacterium]
MGATPPEGAAPRDGDPAEPDPRARLGPPPVVEDRDGIRARAFARLFGEGEPAVTDGRPVGPTTAAPTAIGRFKVLERLGGGGMGVVYAAWDPELERRVAIKLLRADLAGRDGSVGHARLLREAQAMARINHPNVVAVHEVGTHEGQVFVAMELVEGTTLGTWLQQRPRRWRETLAAFLAAGTGIAAAHRAGLVHRDFKPDNVLVERPADGGDGLGRVRVGDFGLARAVAEAPAAASVPALGGETGDSQGASLTRTGALLGTPAYMSPEQWLGRAADERSDQFSFAVALYEGLWGRRPFTASTVQGLMAAVLEGKLAPAGSQRTVPRFVERAVRRALQREAADRFPSMDALLEALRRDPARRWQAAAAAVGIAGVASAATLLATDDTADADRCASVGARIGEIWDDGARAQVEQAIVATGAPFAARTWDSTRGLLDAHAQAWIDAATAACAAAIVTTDHREDAARRERCLDDRELELGALVELLGKADIGIALQAVDAVARLPDASICSDPRRLSAYREPADAQARTRAANGRAELARATASGAVGHYRQAADAAQGVVEIAIELDDPALEAAALLVRGQNEAAAGDWRTAEATLRKAVARAELAEDHAVRAQALTHLVFVVGIDGERFDEAQALAAGASSALKVIGADALLQAQLDGTLGTAARKAKRLDLALVHQRAALATTTELFGEDHPSTLRALSNLATTLAAAPGGPQGGWDEAEAMHHRAAAGLERVLGGDHPNVAVSLSNLAILVAQRGRPAEAVALLRRSIAIRERNDPTQASLTQAYFNLGRALYDSRDYVGAIAQYQRALQRRLQSSQDPADLAEFYGGIGNSAFRAGQPEVARPAFERRLELELAHGSRPELVAAARVGLARARLADAPATAKALLDEARPVIAARCASAAAEANDRALLRDITVLTMLADSLQTLQTIAPG